MERFRLMSIAINKAKSEDSDFYSTTGNRREVASQALGLLRQILNDPNGAGKLYALLDQDYDVQVGVSQMEGRDGTTIKNTIKNNLKTLVTSKIKRKYPELNKKDITTEVNKLLKIKFPALYKVPMQEPQDIAEPEDDFEFDLPDELKEDRKTQERRRIYELGESHASLLRSN